MHEIAENINDMKTFLNMHKLQMFQNFYVQQLKFVQGW